MMPGSDGSRRVGLTLPRRWKGYVRDAIRMYEGAFRVLEDVKAVERGIEFQHVLDTNVLLAYILPLQHRNLITIREFIQENYVANVVFQTVSYLSRDLKTHYPGSIGMSESHRDEFHATFGGAVKDELRRLDLEAIRSAAASPEARNRILSILDNPELEEADKLAELINYAQTLSSVVFFNFDFGQRMEDIAPWLDTTLIEFDARALSHVELRQLEHLRYEVKLAKSNAKRLTHDRRIDDDTKTLYWVNRRNMLAAAAGDKERFVFITADFRLKEAYEKWVLKYQRDSLHLSDPEWTADNMCVRLLSFYNPLFQPSLGNDHRTGSYSTLNQIIDMFIPLFDAVLFQNEILPATDATRQASSEGEPKKPEPTQLWDWYSAISVEEPPGSYYMSQFDQKGLQRLEQYVVSRKINSALNLSTINGVIKEVLSDRLRQPAYAGELGRVVERVRTFFGTQGDGLDARVAQMLARALGDIAKTNRIIGAFC